MTKLNKQSIVDLVAEYDCIPTKKLAAELVDDIISLIQSNVIAGNEVSIAGFGKFYKFAKTADGKPTGKFTPKFTAFKDFKDAVNA